MNSKTKMYKYLLDLHDIRLMVKRQVDEDNCFELNVMRNISFDLSNIFKYEREINGNKLYLPISTTIDGKIEDDKYILIN